VRKIKHRKPNHTTLWYVGVDWYHYTIVVSKKIQSQLYRRCLRIRSKTGRAAGRKYLRNNLPSVIIGSNEEWDNPFAFTGWPESHEERKVFHKKVKRQQNYISKFKIEVIK